MTVSQTNTMNCSVVPPGAKTRRILPQEWIQDYFSPVVGVLSCDDTEALCRKNNLTFVEILQPFSKLLTDVTVKDPDGVNHSISALNVTFQDFRRDYSRTVNSKLMSDMVAEITDEPQVSKSFNRGESTIEAPGFTPWFDAYMKLYLQSIPAMEHEFFRHHLGVVFVVAANRPNPMETFRHLIHQQQKVQNENKATNYPPYLTPHILKYYILVQDVYETEESVAHDIFTQMQQIYGSNFCHLLQINSRTQQPLKDDESSSNAVSSVGGNPGISDHWFTGTSHRFCNAETRFFASPTSSSTPTVSTPVLPAKIETPSHSRPEDLDHPLAVEEKSESPVDPLPPVPKLTRIEYSNVALHLTPNDVDRIRIFVREFVIRGLIPHVERHMRHFNDAVTNRKSRSLFSGAKRWFGQTKPGATGTSVIYGKDAPELQIRKLGDLYFMMKLYKHAYSCYHTAKKDFQSDEAWNYYAGAAEMAALSQFMQNDPAKKYPSHYIEDSITKYLHVCQMPEFAVRASLFDALCLKYNGMFHESASSYLRITNETKDLRSAILLEQAAYCYLLANPSLIRKYAFHIILAGFRFSKCGQKKHSARCYDQGYQIYKGKGWSLSEDHILYTMGHQKLLLKDHSAAACLFNQLLELTCPNLNPLQQMCQLREFFIVHHMREKEGKKVAVVTIPKIDSQQIVLDLSGQDSSYEQLLETSSGSNWQNVERIAVEQIRGPEFFLATKTSQSIFGPASNNTLRPTAVSGERIRILLPVENPFQTPFLLKKVHLLWKFVNPDETTYTNDDSTDGGKVVKAHVLDSVTLDKSSKFILDLSLTVNEPVGELTIVGFSFCLKALFPQSESTDYAIHGKQYFSVRGPRLNATKPQRTAVTYAKDNRLQLNVVAPLPKLEVKFSEVPEVLHQGEIRKISMELMNSGKNDLCNVHLIHHNPGNVSVQNDQKSASLFPFPVVSDASLRVDVDSGRSQDLLVDILPVELANSRKLEPGKSHATSLWFRGHDGVGSFSISLYFYYEAAGGRHSHSHYRMFRTSFTVKVLPLVSVSASLSRDCLFNNNRSQTALLAVTNADTSQEHQVYVSQLSLMSHTSVVHELISANETVIVNRGESIVFGFKTRIEDTSEGSQRVRVSSIEIKGGKHVNIGESPFIDFIKPAFTFGATKKQEPILADDIVVLVWRAANSSFTRMGLLHVPLQDNNEATKEKDCVDSANDDASTSSSLDLNLPALKLPCRAEVEIQNRFEHDFTSALLLLVPLQVTFENVSSEPGRLFVRAERDLKSMEGTACKYLGCTRSEIKLESRMRRTFKFRILVTSPGVYNNSGLRFQFLPWGSQHQPEEEDFIPLDVTFLALQTV